MRSVGLFGFLFAVLMLVFSGCSDGRSEFIAKGRKAARAKNYPDALVNFEKALALDPMDYNALWGAADVHEREGNLVKQAEILEKIMGDQKLAKDYAGVVKPALVSNYIKQGEFIQSMDAAKAEDFFRKAIELSKKSEANVKLATLLGRQGDSALKKGEYKAAQDAFAKAAKLRIPRRTRNQLKGKGEIASFFAFKAEYLPTFTNMKQGLVDAKIYDEKTKSFIVEAAGDLSGIPKKDPEYKTKSQRSGLYAITDALSSLAFQLASKPRPDGSIITFDRATVDVLEQGPVRIKGKNAYRFKVSLPEDALFEKVQKIQSGELPKKPEPAPVDAAAQADGATAVPAPAGAEKKSPTPAAPATPK